MKEQTRSQKSKPATVAKRFFSQSPEKAIRAVCEKQLAEYLPREALDEVYAAFRFAEQAHRGQFRHSGEEYIHHPIEVAATLAELQMDSRSIIAALLHDVIEDTEASKEEIVERFGEDIALLVDGVSKIGQIKFDTKEHAEAENFRKMLMAMAQDVRVMIIKLADRLHNMRTLDIMLREKQRRIAKQTLEVYAPIAERLGLYHWARELQDLSFRYLNPVRHKAISKALQQRQGNRKRVVEKVRSDLEKTIADAGVEEFTVIGRRKTVFSIYKKMQNKRRSFDELHDIYGFRVIVQSVEDCYRVLGIVHNAYKPIPGRFADYIAIPKLNGYQSLHTVVFGALGDNIEVQIRTTEMDQVAEAGVAAHWVYKSEDSDAEESNTVARQWLLELLDPAQQSGSPVEFLEHLKTDLYPDKVYVFTPKGDIKKLPRGATALDFAYAVHTDVGTHCTGARINRELASLPTVLNNGDHVEIMTSKRSWPNTSWLNYAVTARARIKIRNYLKAQTKEDALKLGKRLLAGALKQRLFGRGRVSKEIEERLLEELGLEDWSQLLTDIGLGNRLPDMVARQIARLSETDESEGKVLGQEALVIRGSEGLLVTYAKCCYPLPGDTVIGTFTAGHGLVVHTTGCTNIAELRKQPDRCLMVDWGENLEQQFPTRLQVKVTNIPGTFATIASAIAESGSNIIQADLQESADNTTHTTLIDLVIEVEDRTHLAGIMRLIKNQDTVVKVVRKQG